MINYDVFYYLFICLFVYLLFYIEVSENNTLVLVRSRRSSQQPTYLTTTVIDGDVNPGGYGRSRSYTSPDPSFQANSRSPSPQGRSPSPNPSDMKLNQNIPTPTSQLREKVVQLSPH